MMLEVVISGSNNVCLGPSRPRKFLTAPIHLHCFLFVCSPYPRQMATTMLNLPHSTHSSISPKIDHLNKQCENQALSTRYVVANSSCYPLVNYQVMEWLFLWVEGAACHLADGALIESACRKDLLGLGADEIWCFLTVWKYWPANKKGSTDD